MTNSSDGYILNTGTSTTPLSGTPISVKVYTYNVYDDLVINNPKQEGIDMFGLYDVYLVYAEDRKNPVIVSMFGVIAASDEDAKIKSGLMSKVEEQWDADYLTFIVKKIGEVKVKSKPQEVKQV